MLRPWDRRIVLHRAAGTPVYLQIVAALIGEMRDGRLAPGAVLPGTRELAARLGVNRKTVLQAYDELVAQGWLTGAGTRGTFVSERLPVAASVAPAPRGGMPKNPHFAVRGGPAQELWRAPASGSVVFDDGLPDGRLMPVAALARAQRRALLAAAAGNRLGYGDPRGSLALRRAVATMLTLDRGIDCGVENICLVRGTQMGIFLAAQLLVGPGDTVAVEQLSYPPARQAFAAAGAQVAAVALDEGGMRPEALEALCRRQRVRAVYVTPHHQFPTTVVMRPERRLHLLALAEQFGFAVVEDDYDHEFHFAHTPMLPLASADRWGRVIYIGSMSKLLAPNLRVGFLVAPEAVIARAAAQIMVIDRQGDSVTELAVAELMESGAIKSHTRRVVRIYAERRAAFAEALRAAFGERVSFALPDGGLALWVRLAGVEAAAMERERVWFRPGAAYAADGAAVAGMRLGFGSLDESELREGVRRLARCVG